MVASESAKIASKKYRDSHLELVKEKDKQRHKNRYANDEEYRKKKLEQMKAYRDSKKMVKAN